MNFRCSKAVKRLRHAASRMVFIPTVNIPNFIIHFASFIHPLKVHRVFGLSKRLKILFESRLSSGGFND